MEIERAVVAGLADQGHDALRLPQRIGADDMRPLGKEPDRFQELADLSMGGRVAEDRQAEGRLGDEDVAGHGFEAGASRVALALVIPGGDDPQAAAFDDDLRRSEHMPGRPQPEADAVDGQLLAIGQDLLRQARPPLPQPSGHDGEGLARGEHMPVAGPGVIGMAVADHRTVHGAGRIDEEAAGLAMEAGRSDLQPGFRVGSVHGAHMGGFPRRGTSGILPRG